MGKKIFLKSDFEEELFKAILLITERSGNSIKDYFNLETQKEFDSFFFECQKKKDRTRTTIKVIIKNKNYENLTLHELVLVLRWFIMLVEEKNINPDLMDIKHRFDSENRKIHSGESILEPILDNLITQYSKRRKYETWPEKKTFCIVPSHDVDILNHASLFSSGIALHRAFSHRKRGLIFSSWKYLIDAFKTSKKDKNKFYKNIDYIANFEMQKGFKSTFYFFAAPWDGHPYDLLYDPTYQKSVNKLIKNLNNEGFEIGLHSSIQSYFNPAQLIKEKKRIERITGDFLMGVRQHELTGQPTVRTEQLASAGFIYDSSTGFNHIPGFRYGLSSPFTPFESRIKNFIELPLSLLDNSLFYGAKSLGISMEKLADKILAQTKKAGGMLVLDFHPHVFDNDEYPGWGECYQYIIKQALEMDAWIAPAKDVSEWWLKRRKKMNLENQFKPHKNIKT